MTDFNSIHLQNIPDVSGISYDDKLVEEMDMVKEICSVALFLRDKENIRVRLPLNKIKIIGDNLLYLEKYKDIIADEINVKNVVFDSELKNVANFVLEVNLKKLGAKYGEKLKDIMKAVKSNDWKKLDNGKLEIANQTLEEDEYTIKLKPKNDKAKNICPLSNNKSLIELDFNITPELEYEGVARDLVRVIQQNRKDANLNLSDRINLFIKTNSSMVLKAIEYNKDYIQSQTLSKTLDIVQDIQTEFSFGDDFNGDFINIGFNVCK